MMKRIVLIVILPVFLVLLTGLPVQAQSPTEGERIARLEEAVTNLATKADIAELRGELKADIAELRGEFRGMQWAMGVGFLVVIGVTVWVNREKKPNSRSESVPLSTNPQAQ